MYFCTASNDKTCCIWDMSPEALALYDASPNPPPPLAVIKVNRLLHNTLLIHLLVLFCVNYYVEITIMPPVPHLFTPSSHLTSPHPLHIYFTPHPLHTLSTFTSHHILFTPSPHTLHTLVTPSPLYTLFTPSSHHTLFSSGS